VYMSPRRRSGRGPTADLHCVDAVTHHQPVNGW
jgi:hypothetical protein